MRAYKNVKRISDNVYSSYHPPKIKFVLGEYTESPEGISCYLTGRDANIGSYSKREDSFMIEISVDSDSKVIPKKHLIYDRWLKYVIVYKAKFIRVVVSNAEGL